MVGGLLLPEQGYNKNFVLLKIGGGRFELDARDSSAHIQI
jgi:hypothetical protein